MNPRYEIVQYRPELKAQVADLQQYLWSQDIALNSAYLEWKHERNPYVEKPLIHLALCDGRAVGMRGMYGAKWQAGQPPQTFLAPCGSDLVIAPDHRHHGLLTKIMEAAVRDLSSSGYSYAFNLSASLPTQLTSLMTGWRSAGPLGMAHWRSRRATRRLGSLTRGLPGALLAKMAWSRLGRGASHPADKHQPFRRFDRNGASGRGEVSSQVSLEQTLRPAAMAELVERIGSDGRIRHVRDEEYFSWRFQNPRSLYRFLFWVDAEVEAYLVLQASAHRVGTPVSVIDWEATHERARCDLLEAAIRWGEFDELTIWSATLPSDAKTLLDAAGFSVRGGIDTIGDARRARARRPSLLIRRVSRELPGTTDWLIAGRRVLDLGDWDLRMVYSDAF